jgi:hypothetical protein
MLKEMIRELKRCTETTAHDLCYGSHPTHRFGHHRLFVTQVAWHLAIAKWA